MKIRNQIEFVVYGEYGLFTNPLMKMGGEKMTLPLPTYSALKGITESIYWKPSIIWYIDEVRIMNPIDTEPKAIRPSDYGQTGNTLATYMYLRRPCYEVRAHFEFNRQRPDLSADWNEAKHHHMARRAVRAGGRRDIFLGTRECQAYVEACVYGARQGAYDEESRQFATMLHGITYPDEQKQGSMMQVRLWQPEMVNGTIIFPRPEACTHVRDIREFKPKTFEIGRNMRMDEEEVE